MDPQHLQKKQVIRGARWEGVRLANQEVRATVVESQVRDSSFSAVVADHAFWGAGNLWEDCAFDKCTLRAPISPQNRFVRCSFRNCTFDSYSPCETVFLSCTFENDAFECLKARPNMRNKTIRAQVAAGWPFPEIAELDDRRFSVLLRNCSLERSRFVKSTFRDVWMEGCRVSDVRLVGCDMSGLQSDERWWTEADQQDPLVYYLKEVLVALAERRPGSPSIANLNRLINELGEGHGSRDWLGFLEELGLPEDDFDALESIADQIQHP